MGRRGGAATWVSVGLLCGLAAPACAQTPVLQSVLSRHRVALGAGWDSAWALELGGSFGFRGALAGQDLQVDVGVVLPVFALARPNLKVMGGVGSALRVTRGFRIGVWVGSGAAVSQDTTGTKLAWLAQVHALPGYWARRWHLALSTSWRGSLVTATWPSAAIDDLFADRYPQADGERADGTAPGPRALAFAANRFRVGLNAVHEVSAHTLIFADGGLEFTPQRQGIVANPSFGQLPLFAMMGVAYAW